MLLSTDNEGQTVWQLAACGGKLEVMQKIWEWDQEKLTTQEINNTFLMARDYKGMTAWHVAALCNNLFFREFM